MQANGTTGEIVGGPITANGHVWWKVDYVAGTDGWSAGDFLSIEDPSSISSSVSSVPSTGILLPLQKGSEIYAVSNLNVRSAPTISGALLGVQSIGSTGSIIDGPIEAGGHTWWSIDYKGGSDGWSVGSFIIPKSPSTISGTVVSIPGVLKSISRNNRVIVTEDVNTRVKPTADSIIQGVHTIGEKGTVVDGPIDTPTRRWWKIDYVDGADGWSVSDYLKAE